MTVKHKVKVLTVFGTRPEAIKLAPIILELQRRAVGGDMRPVICITGQHREMLDQVLELFHIRPDYNLQVMRENQTPTQVAASILEHLTPVLTAEAPDWVLIQGDTTTVMAAALTSAYAKIKVAHVEAGLRTSDKWRPFPEEINRRVTSVTADLHFAPTESAKQNLIRENVPAQNILVTGNSVIDALHSVLEHPYNLGSLGFDASFLTRPDKKLILVTAHRRENFGCPLEDICMALRDLATQVADDLHLVYAVHMNPNVWEPVHRLLSGVPNIHLVPPLEYLPLVKLMQRAYLILTDSGGIQEEAPALGVPVLVLRDVTERPEAVQAGVVKLVGTDRNRIVTEVKRLLKDPEAYRAMARVVNVYGDGKAAVRIVKALMNEEVEPFHSEVGT